MALGNKAASVRYFDPLRLCCTMLPASKSQIGSSYLTAASADHAKNSAPPPPPPKTPVLLLQELQLLLEHEHLLLELLLDGRWLWSLELPLQLRHLPRQELEWLTWVSPHVWAWSTEYPSTNYRNPRKRCNCTTEFWEAPKIVAKHLPAGDKVKSPKAFNSAS